MRWFASTKWWGVVWRTGNSDWKPDPNVEPGDRQGTNPEHKTWSK